MNKISIGFSRPKTWKPLAEIIKILEGTKYSHVFVTWKCTNIDRRKIFESVGSGSRILSNVVFKKSADIVELYSFEVSDDTLFRIEQKAHDQTGRPYGFKALVGLLIMRSFNVVNRVFKLKGRQGNPFRDGEYSQVCVESAAMILSEIDKTLVIDDIENYGLLEINHIIKKHGKRIPQEKLDRINGRV